MTTYDVCLIVVKHSDENSFSHFPAEFKICLSASHAWEQMSPEAVRQRLLWQDLYPPPLLISAFSGFFGQSSAHGANRFNGGVA